MGIANEISQITLVKLSYILCPCVQILTFTDFLLKKRKVIMGSGGDKCLWLFF